MAVMWEGRPVKGRPYPDRMSWLMKSDGQELCKSLEVLIRRENGETVAYSYSANQEVGVRSLDPLGATPIKELSRRNVIVSGDG